MSSPVLAITVRSSQASRSPRASFAPPVPPDSSTTEPIADSVPPARATRGQNSPRHRRGVGDRRRDLQAAGGGGRARRGHRRETGKRPGGRGGARRSGG